MCLYTLLLVMWVTASVCSCGMAALNSPDISWMQFTIKCPQFDELNEEIYEHLCYVTFSSEVLPPLRSLSFVCFIFVQLDARLEWNSFAPVCNFLLSSVTADRSFACSGLYFCCWYTCRIKLCKLINNHFETWVQLLDFWSLLLPKATFIVHLYLKVYISHISR